MALRAFESFDLRYQLVSIMVKICVWWLPSNSGLSPWSLNKLSVMFMEARGSFFRRMAMTSSRRTPGDDCSALDMAKWIVLATCGCVFCSWIKTNRGLIDYFWPQCIKRINYLDEDGFEEVGKDKLRCNRRTFLWRTTTGHFHPPSLPLIVLFVSKWWFVYHQLNSNCSNNISTIFSISNTRYFIKAAMYTIWTWRNVNGSKMVSVGRN